MPERFSDKNLSSFWRTDVYFDSLLALEIGYNNVFPSSSKRCILCTGQIELVYGFSLMFSFVLDIFWCYLEIFVVGCSSASSFADSSVIPQIGISRASCGIAGNHHQFRFRNPPQVSSKSTPHVVIVELVFQPTVFCTIIDFLLFLRSMILAWLGNN